MESNDSSVSIEGGRTLNTQKIKECILPNLTYLFIFWLVDKIGAPHIEEMFIILPDFL